MTSSQRKSSFIFWVALWIYEYSADTKSIYKGLTEASFATQIWLLAQAEKVTTANSIIINAALDTLYSVGWTWEECVYSSVEGKRIWSLYKDFLWEFPWAW